MMDVTPLLPEDVSYINKYGNGGFTVGDARFDGNIFISAQKIISLPNSVSIDSFDISAIAEITEIIKNSEIFIIGTGDKRVNLQNLEFNAEIMDTGAACRTYNILLSEWRDVSAILFAV